MARGFAIVPAAGRSLRMGRPKLLLPWGVSTIIETVLGAWHRSNVARVVVVVHPEDQILADLCRSAGVEVLAPDVPPPEMKASIRCALKFLRSYEGPDPADAWLVAPADLPLLNTATINAVLAAHDPAQPRIIVPCQAGRRGHPVLFPWPLADAVNQLGADEGLNRLLDREDVLELELPGAALSVDLDTPEEYHRLYDEHHRGGD